MPEFDVVSRIKELCASKGISFYKLSKISGIPQTTLTNILNRGTIPSIFTLEKICKTLDITLAQFFCVENEATMLSEKQKILLELFVNLPTHKQDIVIAYMEGMNTQ